jgi:hypothetical protein
MPRHHVRECVLVGPGAVVDRRVSGTQDTPTISAYKSCGMGGFVLQEATGLQLQNTDTPTPARSKEST